MTNIKNEGAFEKELEHLINRHSKDNDLNTPDFILAQYIMSCLDAYTIAIQQNKKWHGGTNDQE